MKNKWFGGVVFGTLAVCVGAYITIETPPEIVGFVIPHHDLVSSTRAAFLKEVAAKIQPKTIILISPDHFDHASAPLVSTDRVWNTIAGEVMPNTDVIRAINIPLEDDVFDVEHGITSVLAPLKVAFPNSTIVPILANRQATYREITDLMNTLNTECDACIVVASVDFSHTNQTMVAELHDRLVIRGLTTRDGPLIYQKAEVDSPESLLALITWARLHDAKRFSLFAHTNSGDLSGTEVGEITSHLFGTYERGEAVRHMPEYTFMIGGDVMFARGVAEAAVNPFAQLGERFFWGVDDALLNLEGVFTASSTARGREQGWEEIPPRLTFDPYYVRTLRWIRATVLGLANNHGFDAGEEGTLNTQALLHSAGVAAFGHSQNNPGARVYVRDDTDIPVVYVALNALDGFTGIQETMAQYRDTHKIIVFMHWGHEYNATHTPMQETLAHMLVDEGADLVVGSHPHVIQDVEVYKRVPIIYSLGNFLFDQPQDATRVGAVLGGAFTAEGLELFFVPIHTYLESYVLGKVDSGQAYGNLIDSLSSYKGSDNFFYFPYEDGIRDTFRD
jgi:poly-gamma-glutamate synthesis protein (capsule biosynthesis protein)